MAELILVVICVFLGLLGAAWSLRSIVGRTPSGSEFERLPAAVQGAARRFSRLQLIRSLQCTAGLGLAALAALGVWRPISWANLPLTVIGLLLGALLCAGTQAVVSQLGVSCAGGLSRMAWGTTSNDVAWSAVRAGVAVATLVEAVSLAATLLLWLIVPAPLSAGVQWALGAAVVGAHATAMLAQVSGTSLHAVGRMGRRMASGRTNAFPYQLDPRNPSLVVDGVGLHVGVATSRATDSLCASLLCGFSVVTLLGLPRPIGSPAVATVFAFGLSVRAVSLVAALYVANLARIPDAESTWASVRAAGLAFALLVGLAAFGAGRWLLDGDASWLLTVCAVTGMLGALLSVARSHQALARRGRRARDPQEDASAALPAAISAGAFDTVRGALLPTILVVLGVAAAYQLGSSFGMAAEAALMYGFGFAAASPFVSGLALAAPLVESASGWLSLSGQYQRTEVQSRVSALSDAVSRVSRAVHSYFLAWPGVVGLGVALNLSEIAGRDSGAAAGFGLRLTLGLFASSAAIACVLTYCGLVVRHTADVVRLSFAAPRAATGLRGAPSSAAPEVDADRPRYAEVLDRALGGAFRRLPLTVGGVLLVPWVGLLALSASSATSAWLPQFVAEFLVFATLTGTILGLLTEGLATFWNRARRLDPAFGVQLNLAEAIADFADCTVGPTAQIVVKGFVAVCLALVPALL